MDVTVRLSFVKGLTVSVLVVMDLPEIERLSAALEVRLVGESNGEKRFTGVRSRRGASEFVVSDAFPWLIVMYVCSVVSSRVVEGKVGGGNY